MNRMIGRNVEKEIRDVPQRLAAELPEIPAKIDFNVFAKSEFRRH